MNKKVKNTLINIDSIVASVMLILLIAFTFTGVIWRRVFNAPFTWMEEVQLACMVWIVFTGASVAFRTGGHVAIEMVVDLLPKPIQKVVEVIISAIVVFVLAYLFIQSIGFIKLFLRSGRSTSILGIPYALIYGIAPVSLVSMVFNYFYSKKNKEVDVIE